MKCFLIASAFSDCLILWSKKDGFLRKSNTYKKCLFLYSRFW